MVLHLYMDPKVIDEKTREVFIKDFGVIKEKAHKIIQEKFPEYENFLITAGINNFVIHIQLLKVFP